MVIRQRGFRIGQRVELRDSEKHGSGNAYPLPPGWSDGEEVTVIRRIRAREVAGALQRQTADCSRYVAVAGR